MYTGQKVWGFDIGKGSLGEAVRVGNEFKHVLSMEIDEDFAEIKTAAEVRRAWRTRAAHKAREVWLEKCLADAGIEVLGRRKVDVVDGAWRLVSRGDERLEREFPAYGENVCYNSIALRCKLLLGEKLESWQVFKALNSAIQNRGYDAQIPWGNEDGKSAEANRAGRADAAKKNGEDYNGFRNTLRQNGHYFTVKVDPYKIKGDKSSGLLKYISPEKPLKNGEADKKIQAYNYRLCFTDFAPNKVELPKPENYNAADYELCGRWFEANPDAFPLIISKMPNHKTDINNKLAFSTDFIGCNYNYPEASYEERAKIAKAHKDYTLGLFYFWKTDPRTPAAFSERIKSLGLPKDEFQFSGNWPFYMYIREARRLVGDYVMTQHDCQNTKATPESIGMGSYTLDSHNTSRYVDEYGFVQNEGDVQVSLRESGPYKIAYGAIIPKREECQNLFVVCAVSASHIAYGSIRMEPVFMLLGHSAAAAAVQCIDSDCAVQDINYKTLAKTLRAEGQVLSMSAAALRKSAK